ncbi:hypothetical protein ACI2I2_00895 [Scandinavium sp. NPDC088450]|uniref:hypothetical protein n=1 Tax=Scandinavium sp. NPDC088450 TaxID=3364514 RepID=UPI00384C77DB
MTTLVIALFALFMAFWQEINRFPAAGKHIMELKHEAQDLHHENEKLAQEILGVKRQLLELTHQLERIKDPEYYALKDAGDEAGLSRLERARRLGTSN